MIELIFRSNAHLGRQYWGLWPENQIHLLHVTPIEQVLATECGVQQFVTVS